MLKFRHHDVKPGMSRFEGAGPDRVARLPLQTFGTMVKLIFIPATDSPIDAANVQTSSRLSLQTWHLSL